MHSHSHYAVEDFSYRRENIDSFGRKCANPCRCAFTFAHFEGAGAEEFLYVLANMDWAGRRRARPFADATEVAPTELTRDRLGPDVRRPKIRRRIDAKRAYTAIRATVVINNFAARPRRMRCNRGESQSAKIHPRQLEARDGGAIAALFFSVIVSSLESGRFKLDM